MRWNRLVLTWFANHPEVSTVFVSQAATTPVSTTDGRTPLEEKVDGFRRAWSALPKTVRRVVVIRDTPITTIGSFDCVRDVLAAGKDAPGPACALPRSFAVRWDAAVSTVRRLHAKRYHFADLTDFFCDGQRCFPVIGGALAYRDKDHMTVRFSQSLGPYLLRKVRWLR